MFMNSVHEQWSKQCTESKNRSSAQCAHTADPRCAHGACSALRPHAHAVRWAVSWPSTGRVATWPGRIVGPGGCVAGPAAH